MEFKKYEEDGVTISGKEITDYIKKIHNLKGYKNKSKQELYSFACTKLLIKKKEDIKDDAEDEQAKSEGINFDDLFETASDKREARKLFARYLKEFTFDSTIEREEIKDLIWYEISMTKLKEKANKTLDKDGYIPDKTSKQITEINKIIIDKKTRLGLIRDKRTESERPVSERWKGLVEKCEAWARENQLSRELKCSHCGNLVLLRMRTDAWESQKHPYFPKDRIFINDHFLHLYKENKITKKDLAHALYCDVEYIDWILDKYKLRDDYEEMLKFDENIRKAPKKTD